MGSSSAQTPILQVNKLKKYFRQDSSMFGRSERWLKAVDGVTFTIQTGKPWDWLARAVAENYRWAYRDRSLSAYRWLGGLQGD